MSGVLIAVGIVASFFLGLLCRKPIHRRTAATKDAVTVTITADTADAQRQIAALDEKAKALSATLERLNIPEALT